MPHIDHKQLRRYYEAAKRDKTPQRFFGDLRESLVKGEEKAENFSLRKLFQEFVPHGNELLETWDPQYGGHGEIDLLEAGDAVDTSAFSNITGQIVYSKVKENYESEEFVFSRMVPEQTTSFSGEKIPGVSRLGNRAEIVEEGKPYPTAGLSEDWIRTPETKKRGNIVPVTKEAVFFDRTGLVLKNAGEVGDWLGEDKEERIIDCIIDENTTAHRYNWRDTVYATYQASSPWVNVKTSNGLVDWTDVDGAEQVFVNLRDPWTGKPIKVRPSTIITTPQLNATAAYILGATEIEKRTDTAANVTKFANPYRNKYKHVSSALLADRLATDTHWFLGAPERAFAYMVNWKLKVDTAPPNSEDEFKRDIVTQFKASERGAAATIEPRYMVQNQQ